MSNESAIVRNQPLVQFMYEQMEKTFGKTKILERKVKEIIVTTFK